MTRLPSEPPIVPKKYAGKWIAWNFEGTKILASGQTFQEAEQEAKRQGEQRPVLSKVPKGRFIGVTK